MQASSCGAHGLVMALGFAIVPHCAASLYVYLTCGAGLHLMDSPAAAMVTPSLAVRWVHVLIVSMHAGLRHTIIKSCVAVFCVAHLGSVQCLRNQNCACSLVANASKPCTYMLQASNNGQIGVSQNHCSGNTVSGNTVSSNMLEGITADNVADRAQV